MNLDQAFQTFLVECDELLQDMEDKLLELEQGQDSGEAINSIFRAAHTIKGSAGLFGLDAIVGFTHIVESVLDKVREGEIGMDNNLITLMLSCKDYIGKMIESLVDGQVTLDQTERAQESKLSAALFEYLQVATPDVMTESREMAELSVALDASVDVLDNSVMDNENWHISVRFGPDVLRNGMDPLSFLRYLGTLGSIERIVTFDEGMPAAEDMDPESCYLAFEINFHSAADKATIENVFEFVRDDCQLHIIPPRAKADEFIHAIESMPASDLKLGEYLVHCGTLTPFELERILTLQSQGADGKSNRQKLGEIIVDENLADPEVVQAALNKQALGKKGKDKLAQTVRVDAEKLDHLINLIGELVIAGAGIQSEVRQTSIGSLQEASTTMIRLIEEVRDGALNLRMVQIGETFNRFQRVVRDVSKDLGKEIELEIFGSETELDKTVIEKISDPLTHLVRNSIDHGIESPNTRLMCGKPANGTVTLNAFHESGCIVIEVSDDGGGLNRDRILAKAREKGLVAHDDELTDQQIYQLIFEAGFSTADQVSNISGRGVGMDVVRRNIEALRGTIEIASEANVGTTIRIRLPLTLAIIDGFMMGVGDAAYVVPLEIVEECMELSEAERLKSQGRNYINLRGEVLPFIRLREHFHEHGKTGKRENIVIVRYGNQKAGFVVDQLMGEFQTVIKPLGSLFDHVKGISGSTILGSGEVALILDAPALIHHAVSRDSNVLSSNARPSVTH